jgi:hypothetical protein
MRHVLSLALCCVACTTGVAPNRESDLCQLARASDHAGKGHFTGTPGPLVLGTRRTFQIDDPLIGAAGVITLTIERNQSPVVMPDGGLYLVAVNTGVTDSDGYGQAWFGEVAPGLFSNAGFYFANALVDGGLVGPLAEADLRLRVTQASTNTGMPRCELSSTP